jgi:electron transfer flavoprotein alpha/beta subunit
LLCRLIVLYIFCPVLHISEPLQDDGFVVNVARQQNPGLVLPGGLFIDGGCSQTEQILSALLEWG